MTIDHIATRFDDHPHPQPGHVTIDDPYRRRWWLPVLGPTSTCLLNHLCTKRLDGAWCTHDACELAAALGVGTGTGHGSPLMRTLKRLIRFRFGHFDIAPDQGPEPCLTLYRTVPLVPERYTSRWPDTLQLAHHSELAGLHRQMS